MSCPVLSCPVLGLEESSQGRSLLLQSLWGTLGALALLAWSNGHKPMSRTGQTRCTVYRGRTSICPYFFWSPSIGCVCLGNPHWKVFCSECLVLNTMWFNSTENGLEEHSPMYNLLLLPDSTLGKIFGFAQKAQLLCCCLEGQVRFELSSRIGTHGSTSIPQHYFADWVFYGLWFHSFLFSTVRSLLIYLHLDFTPPLNHL